MELMGNSLSSTVKFPEKVEVIEAVKLLVEKYFNDILTWLLDIIIKINQPELSFDGESKYK